jgi:flagellar hook-associated protein 1 FlgK
LAVASPIAISLGSSNTGSLQQVTLKALTNTTPAPPPVTLTFTTTNNYIRSDTGATEIYTPGEAITSGDWSLTLQGAAKAGDTVTIKALPSAYRNLNAGNASAMLDLRDLALFDGAALTDGYAGLMSQIGIRAQSANYSAEVSTSIASNLESERAGVSGVNLDEEAAKLLQFQQAYQASAKMIQISQNIFDTLIQGLGR